jgi:hypothetical protein
MANANTVAAFQSGVGRNKILTAIGTGTTETVFLLGNDTGLTTVLAQLNVPAGGGNVGSTSPLSVNANPSIIDNGIQLYGPPVGSNAPYFSSTSFDAARPFKVRFSGTFTSGVAANDLKVGLYLGTSATVGSDTAIFVTTTGTAGNFGAVSGHFYGEATLIWDSTTGKLDGFIGTNLIAPSGVTAASTTGAAITQASAAAATNLNFLLSYKWNVSNAANTITVAEFAIDQI